MERRASINFLPLIFRIPVPFNRDLNEYITPGKEDRQGELKVKRERWDGKRRDMKEMKGRERGRKGEAGGPFFEQDRTLVSGRVPLCLKVYSLRRKVSIQNLLHHRRTVERN